MNKEASFLAEGSRNEEGSQTYIRCHEADALRLLRVRIKTFGQDTVLGFRSCGKWSEMNSLIKIAYVLAYKRFLHS